MQTCGAGIMSADDLYSTSGSCGCFGNEDRYRIENSQVSVSASSVRLAPENLLFCAA